MDMSKDRLLSVAFISSSFTRARYRCAIALEKTPKRDCIMNRKTALTTIFCITVLISIVAGLQVSKAQSFVTITIKPDGSVEGTDKILRNQDIYTLTGNISGGIRVQKSNIVLDGAGYTIEGEGDGVDLSNGRGQDPTRTQLVNVTIKNMGIINFNTGIRLDNSGDHTIIGNYIADFKQVAIQMGSGNFVIKGNTFVSNPPPASMTLTIMIYASFTGTKDITENNFYCRPVIDYSGTTGVTLSRNYWMGYKGVDNDGDGIGDTPYSLGGGLADFQPLMAPIEVPGAFPFATPKPSPTSSPNPNPTPTVYFLALKWGAQGSGDGQFSNPYGVAVDRFGNVYVADTYNNRIQKFSSTGEYLTKWGSYGSEDSQFSLPNGIAVDSLGNVYVADTGNNRVQKFSSLGVFLTKWGGSMGTGDGQFQNPCALAVDSSGNVYVADSGNCRVQKFSSSGAYLSQWGGSGVGDGQFNQPCGVAVDSADIVYVADTQNRRVQKFSSSGGYLTQWGSYGSGNGRFQYPYGVAVDALGDVYVADAAYCRIQKFTSSRVYLTKWGIFGSGDGQFNYPRGIAVDNLGNVYVADTYNHRVQKFSTLNSSPSPTPNPSPSNSPTQQPTSEPTQSAEPTITPSNELNGTDTLPLTLGIVAAAIIAITIVGLMVYFMKFKKKIAN
jgi:sugar lactone lactonase YvrE